MTRSAVVMLQFNAITLEINSIRSSVYTVLLHFCGSSASLPGKHCIQHLLRPTTCFIIFCRRNPVLGPRFWMSHLLILCTIRRDVLRPNKLSCASVPKKFECSKRLTEKECNFGNKQLNKAGTVTHTPWCIGMYKCDPQDGPSKS